MLRNLGRLPAMLALACLLAGCVSMGLYETARTAPPDEFEYGGSLTPFTIPLGPRDPYALPLALSSPFPELFARKGLSDNSDVGFRWAFGPGMGLDYKQRLASGGIDVATQFGASLYGGAWMDLGTVVYYSLSPLVMVSRESSTGLTWALNAGLAYDNLYRSEYGAGAATERLSFISGVGFPFRTSGSLRIMPAVTLRLRLSGSMSEVMGPASSLSLGIGVGSVVEAEPGDGSQWQPEVW